MPRAAAEPPPPPVAVIRKRPRAAAGSTTSVGGVDPGNALNTITVTPGVLGPFVSTGGPVGFFGNAAGPTGGKIVLRDGVTEPRTVAIIHCVGSRDRNYNNYCSVICCMQSLKFAHLVKERTGATVYNFYIDMRTAAKAYDEFYQRVLEEGTLFIRGRVAEVTDAARLAGEGIAAGGRAVEVEAEIGLRLLLVGVTRAEVERQRRGDGVAEAVRDGDPQRHPRAAAPVEVVGEEVRRQRRQDGLAAAGEGVPVLRFAGKEKTAGAKHQGRVTQRAGFDTCLGQRLLHGGFNGRRDTFSTGWKGTVIEFVDLNRIFERQGELCEWRDAGSSRAHPRDGRRYAQAVRRHQAQTADANVGHVLSQGARSRPER